MALRETLDLGTLIEGLPGAREPRLLDGGWMA